VRALRKARGSFLSLRNILVVFTCREIPVHSPSAPGMGRMCITTSRGHLVSYSLYFLY
jgi:hypothetical protein